MINQRQNLGLLSEMKGHFKRNVLATTKLVELGDRGRQESEGTCLCLPSYRLILIDFFFFFFGSTAVPYILISVLEDHIIFCSISSR